jgi:hypothetical protein
MQDPPSRVARLNYISGNVSFQPAGATDWGSAEPNRPFTTGDAIYTDVNSRAEFHLDLGAIRVGQQSSFSFLTLNDQTVQLRINEGDLSITLRDLQPNQVFEVDSPNAAVSLLRPGTYRFRVLASGDMTFVVVRQGQAEITGGGQAFNLTPGNSASLSGTTQLAFDVELAPPPDDLDIWCSNRDAQEARLASARYLPRSMVGYEDLDQYGGWQTSGDYGAVWYPRTVAAGWAPYHNGHWAWIEPWGWTWVDDAPWGFAPFHYGRWAFIAGRWGWCPGPVVVVAGRPAMVRPVYAPALVAWFGGPGFGVSVHIGGGAPSMGWVPLGFGEVYTPAYHCSPHYFSTVNVSNTTIVKTVNITNVYNTVYVNKTVYNQRFVNVQAPNAVTAMPQNAFAEGRHVGQAGFSVPVEQARGMQPSQGGVVAPPVVPARQALMGGSVGAAVVVHPPAQVMARQVIVRTTPAVTPAPFAARQAYMQQHVGQTHDFASMHQQLAAQAPQPRVAHVTPVGVAANAQPGQRFGTQPQPQPAARPAIAPAPARPAPQPAVQPQPNYRPAESPKPVPPPQAHPNYPAREVAHPNPPKPPEKHESQPKAAKHDEHKDEHKNKNTEK